MRKKQPLEDVLGRRPDLGSMFYNTMGVIEILRNHITNMTPWLKDWFVYTDEKRIEELKNILRSRILNKGTNQSFAGALLDWYKYNLNNTERKQFNYNFKRLVKEVY